MTKLNKQINRCIGILSTSMQGAEVNNILDDIYEENRSNYKKASESFEQEVEKSRKTISNLHSEKEELVKNIKNKYTIDREKSEK